MVKSDIISATKANRLFWLGRYEERVYMTIHVLNKCYDKMIDCHPDEYMSLWRRLDTSGTYTTNDEFTYGMMYDDANPCSVISALNYAMNNAILLREDIMSETLSYIEMSIALVQRCKAEHALNTSALQPVIDWSLAFWGSAEQRLQNHKALSIMLTGRNIENIDMQLRFGYPYRRIALAYDSFKRCSREISDEIDDHVREQLDALITPENYRADDDECKSTLIKYVNGLVRV